MSKPPAAHSLPPVRFWVGCILLAAEVVFLEKHAAISAGGVSGLAIALTRWLPLPVGAINLAVKLTFLALAYWHGGRHMATWTGVAVLVSGTATWVFELLPFTIAWPPLLAFGLILVLAYMPAVLILHAGYSNGGYATLAQVFQERWRVPIGLTLFAANGLSLTLMYLAYGPASGILSLFATLASGPMAQAWWYVCRHTLGEPARKGLRSGYGASASQ